MSKDEIRNYVRKWMSGLVGPQHRVKLAYQIANSVDSTSQFDDFERAVIDEALERDILLFTD